MNKFFLIKFNCSELVAFKNEEDLMMHSGIHEVDFLEDFVCILSSDGNKYLPEYDRHGAHIRCDGPIDESANFNVWVKDHLSEHAKYYYEEIVSGVLNIGLSVAWKIDEICSNYFEQFRI